MQSLQLAPQHLRVGALFSGRLFRIPDYQRPYSWGPRQRADLFRDIQEAHRSGREHFMATVVSLARESTTIAATQFDRVGIVDGQQRITTLVILFKAIAKALDAGDEVQGEIQREIAKLLVKSDAHSLIAK